MTTGSSSLAIALCAALTIAPSSAWAERPQPELETATTEPATEPIPEVVGAAEPSPIPAEPASEPTNPEVERWQKRRRNLWIGFGVFGGLFVVGGIVVLSFTLTAPEGWAGMGAVFGLQVSSPLWLSGLAGMFGFGIAQGLHANNRPAELTLLRVRDRPRLTFDPTRLQLRF